MARVIEPRTTYYILEGMDLTDSRMRNLNLRKNIRRMELDSYFQEKRQELLSEMAVEQSTFRIEFKTVDEQEKFLDDNARELTGEPKGEWQPTVVRLQKALTAFKGDFEQWFSKSIVSHLSRALDPALPHALTASVVELLIDMIFLSTAEEVNTFARRFMEYEPVPNVLDIAIDRSRPLRARLCCIVLLAKIMVEEPSTRHGILRDGGASVLVEQAREVAESEGVSEQELAIMLESCHNFINSHKSTAESNAHMSLVYSLIQPLMKLFMLQNISERPVQLLLKIFNNMVMTGKENVYVSLYDNVGFPQRLLSLLCSENIRMKTLACHLLGHLAYSNKERISEDLFARGLIDRLWESLTRFTPSPDFIKNSLIAAANLADSTTRCELIVVHPIFAFGVQQFSGGNSVDIQLEAISFIQMAVWNLGYSSLETMLKRQDLIHVLVQRLIDTQIPDQRILKENLSTLTTLVNRSKDVFHKDENPIVHAMENIYNLSIVVEGIRNNIKNKLIEAASDILITTIHNTYLENADSI